MSMLGVNPVRLPSSTDDPAAWDRVVLSVLTEWERVPMPPDAEFDPPTPASLTAARAYASTLRDAGEPPPTRVGPDGSGGIAFETLDGPSLVRRAEVSDVGRIDLYEFDAGGRTMRHTPVGP